MIKEDFNDEKIVERCLRVCRVVWTTGFVMMIVAAITGFFKDVDAGFIMLLLGGIVSIIGLQGDEIFDDQLTWLKNHK